MNEIYSIQLFIYLSKLVCDLSFIFITLRFKECVIFIYFFDYRTKTGVEKARVSQFHA